MHVTCVCDWIECILLSTMCTKCVFKLRFGYIYPQLLLMARASLQQIEKYEDSEAGAPSPSLALAMALARFLSCPSGLPFCMVSPPDAPLN